MLLQKKKLELSAQQQQLLREQVITDLTPGALLHDFEALMAFVAEHSLPAAGIHQLLPLASLGAFNARMAHPLKLRLQRPIQKSYPHINGLFLLARATGLLRVVREDSEAQFRLDDAALNAWRALNPTERYFTLFEAYLLHASPEMIGERGGWLDQPGLQRELQLVWDRISDEGLRIRQTNSRQRNPYSAWFHHFALLESFGLVRIKLAKQQSGTSWNIAEIRQTPFGQAVMMAAAIGAARLFNQLINVDWDEETGKDWRAPEDFDAYQAEFQPYFPEWQRNFAVAEETRYQAGIFQFKVSLGKAWRRIAIPSGEMLWDLSNAILDSVDFDNDHLHCFEYKNRFAVIQRVNHDAMDAGPFSSEVRIGDLPLAPGDAMTYLFDFGDDWEFQLLLEVIAPPDKKIKRARLLESHGKAPKQYQDWDDE
ncbi:MAG: plasmid pRiA4b ORF-3 family protein [Blastocatellia bacterium]